MKVRLPLQFCTPMIKCRRRRRTPGPPRPPTQNTTRNLGEPGDRLLLFGSGKHRLQHVLTCASRPRRRRKCLPIASQGGAAPCPAASAASRPYPASRPGDATCRETLALHPEDAGPGRFRTQKGRNTAGSEYCLFTSRTATSRPLSTGCGCAPPSTSGRSTASPTTFLCQVCACCRRCLLPFTGQVER